MPLSSHWPSGPCPLSSHVVHCRVECLPPCSTGVIMGNRREDGRPVLVSLSTSHSPTFPVCLFFFSPKEEEDALRDGGDYVLLTHFWINICYSYFERSFLKRLCLKKKDYVKGPLGIWHQKTEICLCFAAHHLWPSDSSSQDSLNFGLHSWENMSMNVWEGPSIRT